MAVNPTVADLSHKHLDGCEQCREHPFALCTVGAWLLTNTQTAEKDTTR